MKDKKVLAMKNWLVLITSIIVLGGAGGLVSDNQKKFNIFNYELGMKIEERPVDRSELYTADEIFLTGTAAHIQGVGSVDHRAVGSGGIGTVRKKLQDLYFPIVRGQNARYAHDLAVAKPKVVAS